MSLESQPKSSAAYIKMMWREEQLTRQRLMLNEAGGSLSNTQFSSYEIENEQRCFSDLDLTSEYDSGLAVDDTEDIQQFEFALTIPVKRSESSSYSLATAKPRKNPQPSLSGWISQQTNSRTFGLQVFQIWKSYWFVVSMETKTLILNRQEGASSAVQKSFRLCHAECAIRETRLDGNGRFCFSVSVVGAHRRALLAASSPQQAALWTDTLNSIAGALHGPVSPHPSAHTCRI